MSKKMKVLIAVLVAVLLVIGSGAAIALAQEEEEELVPQVEANALLSRVAEILGIPEADLIGAFQQARQELMEERWQTAFYQMLDKAVAEGLLTPEEAQEIKDWWEQKPESLNLGLLRRAFGFIAPHLKHRFGDDQEHGPGMMSPSGSGPRAWQNMAPEDYEELLEKALETGRLTEEQADKFREWLEKRPETSNGLSPQARIFNAMRGRQMGAFARGWAGSLPPGLAD